MLNGLKNKFYLDNVWTSIKEMPIENWNAILETGDLKHLFKDKGKVSERLYHVWADLQQQHINEFGKSELLKSRIRTMISLTKLNLKFIETKDRSLLNLIEIREMELENQEQDHFSFYQVLDNVERYKRCLIDPKQYTVIKWYHSLNNMAHNGRD
jgi:hypothetical protein